MLTRSIGGLQVRRFSRAPPPIRCFARTLHQGAAAGSGSRQQARRIPAAPHSSRQTKMAASGSGERPGHHGAGGAAAWGAPKRSAYAGGPECGPGATAAGCREAQVEAAQRPFPSRRRPLGRAEAEPHLAARGIGASNTRPDTHAVDSCERRKASRARRPGEWGEGER